MSASPRRTAGADGNLPPDRDFDALAAALSRARCRKARPGQRQLTAPADYNNQTATMAEVRLRRKWVATIARRYQADGELHASAQACLDALARRAEVEP